MTKQRIPQDKAARRLPPEAAADLRFLQSVFAELTGAACGPGRAGETALVEVHPKSPGT